MIILFIILFYFPMTCIYILTSCTDLSFFNPIRNYRTWTSLNIVGVVFFTILLNIALPYLAAMYWVYKLFTIGKKKEN